MLRYIPNTLTLFRLILIIPFVLCTLRHVYNAAFYIFVLAGITDLIDGFIARSYHWQSHLGFMLDPLADKLLVASSFIAMGYLGSLPWWLVLIVCMRDFAIGVGVLAWYCMVKSRLTFEITTLSKINTFLQITLVSVSLFNLALHQGLNVNMTIHYYVTDYLNLLIQFLIMCTVITTIVSYIDYSLIWGKQVYENV